MRCPEAQQIAAVLERTVMLPEAGGKCRTFDGIFRPAAAAGGEWRPIRSCMEPGDVAALVLNPDQIAGIRHRHQTRLVVFDIDAHGSNPSPYWHPDGPEASPALQRLLGEAEAVGAASVVFRSSQSGGWHVWVLLPEARHYSVAACIGLTLAARAALQVAGGRLEVFPNLTSYRETSDARCFARPHAFRLPGQQGGATWIGGPVGWCSEPSTAWEEAAAAVELADGAATPAWSELLEEAAVIRRRRVLRGPGVGRHRPHRPHAVEWTGPSQSEKNLGLLAWDLYQPAETPEQLGARVAEAARACPGFSRYASADTVRRLDAWCLEWARSCHHRRHRASANPKPRSSDPGWNLRLHREAVAKVIDAAESLAKSHGEKALRFSERRLAELLTMSRMTFRKVKGLFKTRLAAAIARPVPVGLHPSLKGGTTAQHHQSPVSDPENESLDPVPPVAFRPCRPPPPPPSVMPIAPARDATARREFERNELARWLGLCAA